MYSQGSENVTHSLTWGDSEEVLRDWVYVYVDLGLFEWSSHSVFFIFLREGIHILKASDKSGVNIENDKELKMMMRPNLRRNHNLVSLSHSSSSSDSQLQPGDFTRSENPSFMISQS